MEEAPTNGELRLLAEDLEHKREPSKMPNQRKNIRVVAKPRANQSCGDETRPRPVLQGLDGVVSKRVVFEQWAEALGTEERPSTKRQLSAESVAKCVSVSKRRDAVPHADTHASKANAPAAQPGKPLPPQRTRKQLFKSTDVFQRLDTHTISAGKEVPIYTNTNTHIQIQEAKYSIQMQIYKCKNRHLCTYTVYMAASKDGYIQFAE